MDDIEGCARSRADQHQLHGTRSWRASLRPGSPSQHDLVPTPGLADERAIFNPFDARFHCWYLIIQLSRACILLISNSPLQCGTSPASMGSHVAAEAIHRRRTLVGELR